MKGAGLVPWVVGPSDASFGFYLREVNRPRKDNIQRESLGTDML